MIRATTATIMPTMAPVEILGEGVAILVIFDVVSLEAAAMGMIWDGAFDTQVFCETEKLFCS